MDLQHTPDKNLIIVLSAEDLLQLKERQRCVGRVGLTGGSITRINLDAFTPAPAAEIYQHSQGRADLFIVLPEDRAAEEGVVLPATVEHRNIEAPISSEPWEVLTLHFGDSGTIEIIKGDNQS